MNYKRLLAIFCVLFCYPLLTVFAAEDAVYIPIIAIPGIQGANNFDAYIDALYALSISLAALIAVVKIILAGAKYMLSDLVGDKSSAKDDIRNALIGLLIIIGAVVILNTVNSDLTRLTIFDANDRVSLNDRQPPENQLSMQKICDDLALTDAPCSSADCSSDLMLSLEAYINPRCEAIGCEARCKAIGGVYRDNTFPLPNECTQISETSLQGEMVRLAQQKAIALTPSNPTSVRGLHCVADDSLSFAAQCAPKTIADGGSVTVGTAVDRRDAIVDCRAECLNSRAGASTTDNRFDEESRICIMSINDAVYLTEAECNFYKEEGWEWTTTLTPSGGKCFNVDDVLERQERQCPQGNCDIIKCENYSSSACNESTCKEKHESGVFDETTLTCLVPVIDTSLNINPSTQYIQTLTADEVAAGDTPKNITIITDESVNGFVQVRYEDGTEALLSCGRINPEVCR